MAITNDKLTDYLFLQEMYEDEYFPPFLVDKCKAVLMRLCEAIEAERPKSTDELFELTHAAVGEINELADEFLENDSEIETGACEALGVDFEFIVNAYGFTNVDIEDVIATRDW